MSKITVECPFKLLVGDCRDTLATLADKTVQTCITSPPYFGLRDYGMNAQIGLEQTPKQFVDELVAVFREVRRTLKDDGTLWVNMGDSYAGGGFGGHIDNKAANGVAGRAYNKPSGSLKAKDLIGIPWRLAFALQDDGWYLRQDIIWHKPNPMPESVTDRCTKSHEYIFLLSKSPKYYFDNEAIKEKAVGGQSGAATMFKRKESKWAKTIPGQAYGTHRPDREAVSYDAETRNRRSVWTVATKPFSGYSETCHWQPLAMDAPCGGSLHIASIDCPVYGGLFDLLATALDDAHEGDVLSHTLCTCDRLSLEPKAGFVPIHQLRAWRFGEQSLDSLLQARFASASSHSSQIHKTGLYVATNLACTPCAQRTAHIGRTLAQHGCSALGLDIHESSIWAGGFADNQKPQTLWSIVGTGREQEFFLASGQRYDKITKKLDHFATYPPALILPCVLAGSRPGDTVLDPFNGSGTTGLVALENGRQYVGCELNSDYIELTNKRLNRVQLDLFRS